MSKLRAFTLIEVLIALTIMAIAMTAILGLLTNIIPHYHHLREKNIATWVALNVADRLQLSLLDPTTQTGEETQLGTAWIWVVNFKKTPNSKIREFTVNVGTQSQASLVTFTSFISERSTHDKLW